MHEQHLALNNLQWLICHKSKPIQTKPFSIGTLGNTSISSLPLLSDSLIHSGEGRATHWPSPTITVSRIMEREAIFLPSDLITR